MRKSRTAIVVLILCTMLLNGAAAYDTPYTDVSPDAWYYETVREITELRIMNGTGDELFEPEKTLSRAMFVTILGRVENVNIAAYLGRKDYTDVEAVSWYGPYVAWAADQGITVGTGNGCFSPDDPITRQQMATMLYRYAINLEKDLDTGSPSVDQFADYYVIPVWSRDAIEYMRVTAIMQGDAAGNFNPFSNTTRAEAAAVCLRLYNKMQEGETP